MQIMLRTHNDLGYKQEQRFHLELGLLKLVHAQRLLPLEELLSGEAGRSHAGSSATVARRSLGSCRRRAAASAGSARAATSGGSAVPSDRDGFTVCSKPSPFEADRSRKSEPKARCKVSPDRIHRSRQHAVHLRSRPRTAASQSAVATAVAVEPEPAGRTDAARRSHGRQCCAERFWMRLEDAGQQMLAHNLEEGEWSVRGTRSRSRSACRRC